MICKTAAFLSRYRAWCLAFAFVLPSCPASAATLSTLHTFSGFGDGGFPQSNLVRSSSGVLYGTTLTGGNGGWGTVFELVPQTGGKTYVENTIYSFTGLNDGANPVADLVIGNNNVLYGTTYGGGVHGYGTVFEVYPGQTGGWVFKSLYSFKGGADGAYPAAGVVWRSSSGVLYGTTYGGGAAGVGTAYQVTPNQSTGTWTEKVIYTFQGGTDGAYPIADLTMSNSPTVTLYGTTSQGGLVTIPAGTPPSGTNPGCASNPDNTPCTYENWGTVFQLTGSGGGSFKETQLYTFFGAADGGSPESSVILAPSGVIYGSTFWGGTPTACATGSYPQGCGVIYQLAPPTSGSTWTETALHTFSNVYPDGQHPYRNLVLSSTSGILYGTTYAGGLDINDCFPAGGFIGCGTIFNMTPQTGGSWKKANLTAFDNNNGGAPVGVILSPGGVLYGSTEVGGTGLGYGITYSWAP